ncbi:helix-turn-helix domain-containing protein [Streptomyces sp. WM6372]|uniref:helix-turn-helix domain-containing protein n=1 Tax=Streptomyces sp. WM6372 TaxID=1415555 RepID=UPI003B634EFE
MIHRFNEIGLACLNPRWAGGRPRLLSGDDEDVVVQTATTRPTQVGKPFTRWSIRTLADHLRRHIARPIRMGREALRCSLARRASPSSARKPGKSLRMQTSMPTGADRERDQRAARPNVCLRRIRPAGHPLDSRFLLGRGNPSRPTAGHVSPHPRNRLLPRLLPGRRRPDVGRQPPPQGHRPHLGGFENDPGRPPARTAPPSTGTLTTSPPTRTGG